MSPTGSRKARLLIRLYELLIPLYEPMLARRTVTDCDCGRIAGSLHSLRAPPDRHRRHVCSPLVVRVDGARLSDAQGIDGLHDRRGDRARGDRYSAFLLFAISHHRFRLDPGDALAGSGVDDRVDFAGAATGLFDRRGIGASIDRGSHPALAQLPLRPAFRFEQITRRLGSVLQIAAW
jgi:hypothetical protein